MLDTGRDARKKRSVNYIAVAMGRKAYATAIFISDVSRCAVKLTKSTLFSKGVTLAVAALLVPLSVLLVSLTAVVTPAQAATSNQLNFQGRLLTNTGGLVPDGNYHIEFKLYNDTTSAGTPDQGACTYGGGTPDPECLWRETRTTGNLVAISNGYFSVYLGDVTALPNIDWSQDLYLGMNIGGSAGGAAWDGEMTPRFKLTAVPYAFKASNVASSSTNAASTNSDAVSVTTGNATGATSNSGNITIDTGTATGTTGTISLGATNASGLLLGRAGLTTGIQGSLSVAETSVLTGDVTVGSAAALGKLGVDGDDAAEIQLVVQAAGSQSADILVVENSAGTDYLTIGSGGNAVFNSVAPDSSEGASLRVTADLSSLTNPQNGIYSYTTVSLGSASTQVYSAVQGVLYTTDGDASGASLYGVVGQAAWGGGARTADMAGVLAFGQHQGSIGAADMIAGLKTNVLESGSGSITDARGIYVTSNSGTITDNYGIYVQAQTAGTNDYGIAVQAADTATLWLSQNADNTSAAAGISFGASRDTSIYRSAANTLSTGALVVGGNAISGSTKALVINNGTSTGNVLELQDNGTTVMSVTDGGATLFQNSTNSTTAFQIQNSTATVLFNADTTNNLVTISSPVFQTVTNTNCAISCTITQANVDGNSAIIANATSSSLVITLPDPTNLTAGRVVYVTAANNSEDFTLYVNGGGQGNEISMRENTTATMIWNGSDWTAAGASSSTTLQAAYDNTLTSAGGAELVLNASGGAADGLTVRNNETSSIYGGLLEIQTSIGSNLFSVNNNAVEYASNGGAETAGATSSTFPANTWDTTTGGTVSRYTTTGDNVATGQASVSVQTSGTNHGARNRVTTTLTSGLTYTVSFTVRGVTNFSTLEVLYSPDGTTSGTTSCTSGKTVTVGLWSRITCSFVASGTITSGNSILIRQTDATSRTFYIDNLSINTDASVTYAADGSVDDAGAFATNWTNYASSGTATMSRETSTIYDTSASAAVAVSATAGIGMRNNLAITPQINTQYLVTFYARSTVTMTDSLQVGFLPAGGTGAPSGTAACNDYSTQSVSTSTWTKITCLFTTTNTTITDADLVIYQSDATARTIYVDALTIALNTNNANNVQIGGANKGGPVTLFTLDRSAGPPVAANNDAYLGSMYYDTTTGRIQCYEVGGWGTCGSPPDNIVNLNPEYAGSVLNGTGIGTMTADVCADQPTVLQVNIALCDTGEARNYYKWTSPQATEQTYSVYVTYQLPATFDGFSSDDTVQLTGRVDSTTNAAVTYEMFRSESGSLVRCGSSETTVATSIDTWQTVGINGNEATGCGFTSASANAFVLFKINLKAKSNANAYVSTLTFTTTGR